MKTSKPISTISFNTESFLRGKLRELEAAGILEFWAYIKHDPEPEPEGRQMQIEDYPEYMPGGGEP